MDVFLRIDIDIVAMILLGVIFFIALKSLDTHDRLNKVFLIESVIVMVELLIEASTCVINRRPELWLIPISYVMHMCLFGISPVLTYYWYHLITNLIESNKVITIKKKVVFLIPVIVNVVLVVLTPIRKWVFYIDQYNVYHRGKFFLIAIACVYFYIVYGFTLVVCNRRNMLKQEFIPLCFFSALPMIGSIIQAIFYGPLLMWSSAAFSLVIVYVFLQQRIIQVDDLTGAWSRDSFYTYITQKCEQNNKHAFGVIYVDVDRLKEINDGYGHTEGDFAIKTSIKIIKKIIHKNDIIVRLGGDEFAVILNCDSKDLLDNIISDILNAFTKFNTVSEKPYKIECSFGADIYNSNFSSIEQFLNHVDKLMYINKRMKKEKLVCKPF